MLEPLQSLILITGHYGNGKTNLSVNLALDYKKAGHDVVLCDLDIVNPYFRSADFESLMHANGIATISPTFANTNLDVPALGPALSGVLSQKGKTVIVDVGGDDAGAVALGRYAPQILERPYSMLYVYNRSRTLAREPEDALENLREIETASRLKATHVVNNTHLGEETQPETLCAAVPHCARLAELCTLPLWANCVTRGLADRLTPQDRERLSPVYPVDIYVKKPWEKAE